jgi:hypothetical protein
MIKNTVCYSTPSSQGADNRLYALYGTIGQVLIEKVLKTVYHGHKVNRSHQSYVRDGLAALICCCWVTTGKDSNDRGRLSSE